MPMIRRILRDAEANEYRLSAFVLGVATSPAFQMNVEPSAAATTVAPH
jgi:hypothetical protein